MYGHRNILNSLSFFSPYPIHILKKHLKGNSVVFLSTNNVLVNPRPPPPTMTSSSSNQSYHVNLNLTFNNICGKLHGVEALRTSDLKIKFIV